MTIDEKKKWNEELHYDVNSKVAKMYVLSLGNIDENDYLPGKIIVPPGQSKIIEHARFTYSPIEKALKTQTKAFKYQREQWA